MADFPSMERLDRRILDLIADLIAVRASAQGFVKTASDDNVASLEEAVTAVEKDLDLLKLNLGAVVKEAANADDDEPEIEVEAQSDGSVRFA